MAGNNCWGMEHTPGCCTFGARGSDTNICVAGIAATYWVQCHTQQRFHPQTSIPYDCQTLEIDTHEQRAFLWTVIGWQSFSFVTHTRLTDDWSLPMLMQVGECLLTISQRMTSLSLKVGTGPLCRQAR
jgi:hypothetical protein